MDDLDSGLIDAGMRSLHGHSLQLIVIGAQDMGLLEPGISVHSGFRGLRHHFKLNHTAAALPQSCADAIIASVPAADYNHIFSAGGNGRCVPVQYALVAAIR